MSRAVQIRRAVQAPEYEAAQRLLREYREAVAVDRCFQGFEAELADLPARYGQAGSGLWLAWAGALPLGCVALGPARSEPGSGELKRLYVRPEAQGAGLGRALVETVLAAAQAAGYAAVRLDTPTRLSSANRLYDALGFMEVADPADGGPGRRTRVMARRLSAQDRPARRARPVGTQLG